MDILLGCRIGHLSLGNREKVTSLSWTGNNGTFCNCAWKDESQNHATFLRHLSYICAWKTPKEIPTQSRNTRGGHKPHIHWVPHHLFATPALILVLSTTLLTPHQITQVWLTFTRMSKPPIAIRDLAQSPLHISSLQDLAIDELVVRLRNTYYRVVNPCGKEKLRKGRSGFWNRWRHFSPRIKEPTEDKPMIICGLVIWYGFSAPSSIRRSPQWHWNRRALMILTCGKRDQ